MNDSFDGAELVAQWRDQENQDNPAVRYLPESSQKTISLTKLPVSPVAPLAQVRPGILAAKLK